MIEFAPGQERCRAPVRPVEVQASDPDAWIPDDLLRDLRIHFQRRTRETRKSCPSYAPALFRIACHYGALERARRTA